MDMPATHTSNATRHRCRIRQPSEELLEAYHRAREQAEDSFSGPRTSLAGLFLAGMTRCWSERDQAPAWELDDPYDVLVMGPAPEGVVPSHGDFGLWRQLWLDDAAFRDLDGVLHTFDEAVGRCYCEHCPAWRWQAALLTELARTPSGLAPLPDRLLTAGRSDAVIRPREGFSLAPPVSPGVAAAVLRGQMPFDSGTLGAVLARGRDVVEVADEAPSAALVTAVAAGYRPELLTDHDRLSRWVWAAPAHTALSELVDISVALGDGATAADVARHAHHLWSRPAERLPLGLERPGAGAADDAASPGSGPYDAQRVLDERVAPHTAYAFAATGVLAADGASHVVDQPDQLAWRDAAESWMRADARLDDGEPHDAAVLVARRAAIDVGRGCVAAAERITGLLSGHGTQAVLAGLEVAEAAARRRGSLVDPDVAARLGADLAHCHLGDHCASAVKALVQGGVTPWAFEDAWWACVCANAAIDRLFGTPSLDG